MVDYHLNQLDKKGLIISVVHRNQKYYFDSTWKDQIEDISLLISYLRKQRPREILILLSSDEFKEGITLKQLSIRLKKSSSALHWHIKRLIEDNLLVSRKIAGQLLLKCRIDPNLIDSLGKRIFPNRWENFLDRIFDNLS